MIIKPLKKSFLMGLIFISYLFKIVAIIKEITTLKIEGVKLTKRLKRK